MAIPKSPRIDHLRGFMIGEEKACGMRENGLVIFSPKFSRAMGPAVFASSLSGFVVVVSLFDCDIRLLETIYNPSRVSVSAFSIFSSVSGSTLTALRSSFGASVLF